MPVISNLEQIDPTLRNPVLTIGNFDGVHKGHLSLFDLAKKRAAAINGQSAVMTFDPHPIKVMKPGNGPHLITLTEQKLQLIADAGMDVIFCIPFTKQFASISASRFVQDILVDKIGIREIVVGYDYTFGAGREGNIELLESMGKALDFKVHVVPPVYVENILVSSTSIRNLIQEGKLHEAKKLLGRDYQIGGTVIKGKNRGGRLLGYPTANLALIDELVPKRGVYVVKVLVADRIHDGVTNIGYNPTFGEGAFSVETHILNFQEDLLGKKIHIKFIERLRDEKTFASLEDLVAQIERDIARAIEILKT
ncbi:MAG: bifunctional riboflavin kinase/FAD synthetase [Deltaproteobacteria bacterium]|nr:bifunctional riboflavin kinase/FAD synthetase [Deltaproteobacteria bacterium]